MTSFCTAKETIKKEKKRQLTEWEKIVLNDEIDKGLISKIYKQLIQINRNKTHILILYPVTWLNYFIHSRFFLCGFLWLSSYRIMSYIKKMVLLLPFQSGCLLFLFLPWLHLALNAILNRIYETDMLMFFPVMGKSI